MASITTERMKELLEIYNGLKERITAIDNKYSLDYVEPKIDLPESLNLQKMTYEPKDEYELTVLADQYAAPIILSKLRSVEVSYSTKRRALWRKRTQASRDYADKVNKIDQDYAEDLAKLEKKLTNNGLLFSTTATTYRSAATADYNTRKSECKASYSADVKALDAEETDLETVFNENWQRLEDERQALSQKKYYELLKEEEKAKTTVEKYNNGVDEKEQRYQYTRAKFIESMRRAERDRVLDMTKLYLQLGDVSYRDRMVKEKYTAAQDAFWPLRRNEANWLLSYDSFLAFHLEKYYSMFENWVNTSLLPPN